MKNKKRGCLNCKNFRLCYLFRRMQDALKGNVLLNLYQNGKTPGTYTDVYGAVGKACLEYREIITVE